MEEALSDMTDKPVFLRVDSVSIFMLLILNIVVNVSYVVTTNRINTPVFFVSGAHLSLMAKTNLPRLLSIFQNLLWLD